MSKQSENFLVKEENPYILYSKDVLKEPFLRPLKSEVIDNIKYNKYIFHKKFNKKNYNNDCLIFAESLAKGEPHKEETCLFSVKNKVNLFGDTDSDNILLANKYAENYKANPQIGEAYAIVNTNKRKIVDLKSNDEQTFPYHIAYVILKDGSYNITLEANAAVLSLKYPIFDMYSTIKKKKTFHGTYKNFLDSPKTVVLTQQCNLDNDDVLPKM